jgi:hypothetical protein
VKKPIRQHSAGITQKEKDNAVGITDMAALFIQGNTILYYI